MPAIRGPKSKSKTRRRARDLDQVDADLQSPTHLAKFKETKAAEDLPDLGQWYCIECAKWFESERNLTSHHRGKPHKRRVRALQEGPYTQEEAEVAAGYTPKSKVTEEMEVDSQQSRSLAENAIIRHNEPNDDEEYDAFFSAYKG